MFYELVKNPEEMKKKVEEEEKNEVDDISIEIEHHLDTVTQLLEHLKEEEVEELKESLYYSASLLGTIHDFYNSLYRENKIPEYF